MKARMQRPTSTRRGEGVAENTGGRREEVKGMFIGERGVRVLMIAQE